jgi:beta-glucosidase
MGSRPGRWAHYCATLCFVALGSSCLGLGSAQGAAPQVHPQRWPRQQSPLARNTDLEHRIDDLLARMTPAQKVGQLVQADIGSVKPVDVRKLALGSVLNGGNSSPRDDKLVAPGEWLALADRFYDASVAAGVGVPLLWGTDAVHGHNNIPGATIFPHNIGLGATRDA